jgi:acetyl-CoA synthetase
MASTLIDEYAKVVNNEWESLNDLRNHFEWIIPDQFNAATYLCDIWAEDNTSSNTVAIYYDDQTTDVEGTHTFKELKNLTNKLANYLRGKGIEQGDRVGVNLPRKRETIISYIALWKIGAVPVPLSTLFGPDGLEHRLSDSGAKAAVVDVSNLTAYREIKSELGDQEFTLTVGDVSRESDEADFWTALSDESPEFDVADTTPDDDFLLMYTSGTTGAPKGVRHAHRSVIGQIPGHLTNFYDLNLNDEEVCWSPTEYTWAGTITFILASLLFGNAVVTYETGEAFDPDNGFEVVEQYGVNVALVPPSGLRMMMRVDTPADEYDLDSMRHITSGGEALGSIPEWAEDVFGATVHEVYGQSEIWNMVIGDCLALESTRDGWMGFALPGHEIEVLDLDTREVLEPGEVGEIAIKRDDPTVLKEYWNKPEKTENKFHDDWCLTEDLAEKDADGRFRFVGRTDDVIISSGYRIGPEEVEDSIASHEAVADAGVIGVEDDERGTVPKAFVVLNPDIDSTPKLKNDLQKHVKERLADYEYPRYIEFIDELPRTTTGKIQRSELKNK